MLLPFSVIRQFASQGTPVSSDDESELDEDSSLEEEEEYSSQLDSSLDSSDDDSLHSTTSCGSSALISKNLLRSRDKPGDGCGAVAASGSATGEAEHSRWGA